MVENGRRKCTGEVCKRTQVNLGEPGLIEMISVQFATGTRWEAVANVGLFADSGEGDKAEQAAFPQGSPPAPDVRLLSIPSCVPSTPHPTSLEQNLLPRLGHHCPLLKDSPRTLVILVDAFYCVDAIV